MKKAILVNDYASVEELNKMFEQGYTVDSVDARGVYILTRDKSKKSANDLHETPDKHLNVFDRKDKEDNNPEDYQNNKSKRGLGNITINVKVEVDDSELKQLGEKYSKIGRAITEAFENGK